MFKFQYQSGKNEKVGKLSGLLNGTMRGLQIGTTLGTSIRGKKITDWGRISNRGKEISKWGRYYKLKQEGF